MFVIPTKKKAFSFKIFKRVLLSFLLLFIIIIIIIIIIMLDVGSVVQVELYMYDVHELGQDGPGLGKKMKTNLIKLLQVGSGQV